MRTKGLAAIVLVALALVGPVRADYREFSASGADTNGGGALPSVDGNQSVVCGEGADTCSSGADWRNFLIGSPCTSHLYAGTEFTALHVNSQTGGRITLSFSDTTAPGVSTVSFNDFSGVNDWAYVPRFWLGAQITDKWGARVRYWRLSDTDVHSPDVAPGTTPTGVNFATIFVTDHAEAWTTDIEGVRCAEWRGWKFDGFVGGRHANFSTDSDLLAFGVFTTGNFVNLTLQNSCGFNGTGVTYGGSLRRQIGGSSVYAFGSVRGSNLAGTSRSLGRSDGTAASSPSAPLVGAATVTRNSTASTLAIVEVQAGLELDWPLECIPANCFFRIAYELQNWDIAGPPTGGAGFGGTIGELTTNSFASAGLGGMTLEGVAIGAGLTW